MTQRSTGQSGDQSKRSDRSFAQHGTRRKLGVLYRLAPSSIRKPKTRTVGDFHIKPHDEDYRSEPNLVVKDGQGRQVWPRSDSLQSTEASPSPAVSWTHDRRLSRLNHLKATQSSILVECPSPKKVRSSSPQGRALPRRDVSPCRPDDSADQGLDISSQSLGLTRPPLLRVNAGGSMRSIRSLPSRNLIESNDQMGYFDVIHDHKSDAFGTSLSTTQLFSAGQSHNPLLFGMSKEERL